LGLPHELLLLFSGYPCGIESIKKVLNFKIGFQDLEKVLNLAKMSLRFGISIEIPNGKDQQCKIIFHQLPQAGFA